MDVWCGIIFKVSWLRYLFFIPQNDHIPIKDDLKRESTVKLNNQISSILTCVTVVNTGDALMQIANQANIRFELEYNRDY